MSEERLQHVHQLRGLAADIAPSAVIEAGAQIAQDVRIGPYCIVSSKSVIGRGGGC